LFFTGLPERAASSYLTPKLQPRGKKMKVSSQGQDRMGQDGTERVTTQDKLTSEQNTTAPRGRRCNLQHQSASKVHPHPRRGKTLHYVQLCSAGAAPASVFQRVSGEGKAERMTGKEGGRMDGWEEVQKESPD